MKGNSWNVSVDCTWPHAVTGNAPEKLQTTGTSVVMLRSHCSFGCILYAAQVAAV